MEIVNPGAGLIIWTLFSFASLLALISIIRSDFTSRNAKIAWLLVVVFIPIVGTILYVVYGKKSRIKIS